VVLAGSVSHAPAGAILQPGQLLNAYPPFSMKVEPEQLYSIKNDPVSEQRSFLAHFYEKTKNFKEGQQIQINVINTK
jgi:hypothetical protein